MEFQEIQHTYRMHADNQSVVTVAMDLHVSQPAVAHLKQWCTSQIRLVPEGGALGTDGVVEEAV